MTSFSPPEICLMGPGPSIVSERVRNAAARPTIGHLDPEFIGLMDEVKDLLRYALRTENVFTLPISAPGSAGMEACLLNLLEPGDTALVCINGVFGTRMQQIVERAGATAIIVEDPWGEPVSPDKVTHALQTNPDIKLVSFVHAETSTGALSDAEQISALAKAHGCLTVMDAVTSLGGVPVEVDKWAVDAVYSGTQKCLSCPPGLSPISFSAAAIDVVRKRETPVRSWFLDLSLIASYWGGEGARSYHHTAPVNSIYALHESLLMLKEEGLEAAWSRHAQQSARLQDGLSKLGFTFLADQAHRLPQLVSINIPNNITNEAELRSRLRLDHRLEIGSGLGPLAGQIWRIGLMGQTAQPEHVDYCLKSLEQIL